VRARVLPSLSFPFVSFPPPTHAHALPVSYTSASTTSITLSLSSGATAAALRGSDCVARSDISCWWWFTRVKEKLRTCVSALPAPVFIYARAARRALGVRTFPKAAVWINSVGKWEHSAHSVRCPRHGDHTMRAHRYRGEPRRRVVVDGDADGRARQKIKARARASGRASDVNSGGCLGARTAPDC
jgi:hypothetical protein